MHISEYDYIVVAFSGGKDSTALFLHLWEQCCALGVEPTKRIILMHHLVDGIEGSTLFDWPVTEDYCTAFANHFGVRIVFSWKEGGLERELLRHDALTAPTWIETLDEQLIQRGGKTGKPNTRRRWPAQSADLRVRWCSPSAKIDVGKKAICNDPAFANCAIYFATGERGEESPARAKYAEMEPHQTDLARKPHNLTRIEQVRWVDHVRPILRWSEQQVWEIIERHRVRVHPCYYLGFSRCSCARCIFSSPDQAATARYIQPEQHRHMAELERELNHTIRHKKVRDQVVNISLDEHCDRGSIYQATLDQPDLVEIIRGTEYPLPIVFAPDEQWALPAGAYGDSAGPT